ncbi:MAG: 1-deoxy-D-xylulose-5-phosphate synthase [Eubacterium sp.]|nr:1-deoxy-D-xylulose-5-phosphate synthase [Eubacterium sp.]
MVLDKINQTNDIKKLDKEEIRQLSGEIRQFLIESLSETGGHLASNLGVVELTIALHLTFDLPEDKIIWDVGHQSYTHKILTGRKEGFATLRQYGGMSGFPKTSESDCDCFNTGHSSTSVSAGLGIAAARDLKGENNKVISVIGDGALTGGMAFEALNNASKLDSNFIIVLNDNDMSISPNVGGLSQYLGGIRTAAAYQDLKSGVMESLQKIPVYGERIVQRIRRTKSGIKQLLIPGMLFEDMGILYLGPVDGHDIEKMTAMFQKASRVSAPVLVHVLTEKGRGYEPAVRHPARFHGTEPFEIETGLAKKKKRKAAYTDIFSTVMRKLGDRDEKVVAVTAAMETGTGLKRFHNMFPKRFFDVGIAEEHAVTFAAGLAAGGLKPVFAVYSSFLQRAYDQILHDVCLQDLPVVFAVDRAGIVGSDGETHQGLFDISYLMTIPNMTLMAPKNKWEFSDMIKFALAYGHPAAIRYPRGEAFDGLMQYRAPIECAKSEVLFETGSIALLAYGSMVKTALEVRERLEQAGIGCAIVNLRFAKPLDTQMLAHVSTAYRLAVTMEENVKTGGLGEAIAAYFRTAGSDIGVIQVAVDDTFLPHGNVDVLKRQARLDAESIAQKIDRWLQKQQPDMMVGE